MLTKNVQSIVNYCLLNSCTDMGNARSDVALALLFISKGEPILRKKAKQIFKQEVRRALSTNTNWNEKREMLLNIGILLYSGILSREEVTSDPFRYIRDIHEVIKSSIIQQTAQETYWASMLFHYMIPPLYGEQIDKEEEKILLRIGKCLHKRFTEKELFISETANKLLHLYLIASILNNCEESTDNIVKEIISLHTACRMKVSYPLSALIKTYCPLTTEYKIQAESISLFRFKRIMTVKEITDCVLGEILCNEYLLTKTFLSDNFLTDEFLVCIAPNFSLHTGLARLLFTYALATTFVNDEYIKKVAITLMAL